MDVTHVNSNTEIYLPGYTVFRNDRPKQGKAWKSSEGIAVLVKESLRGMFKSLNLYQTAILSGFEFKRS